MTNDDVITTAFRVWGRELYKTTSLAKVADALEVSKPALYRHFPDKQALLEAMEARFYDDYAEAVKPITDGAGKSADWREQILGLVEFIAGFFAGNFDYFIYCMIGLQKSNKGILLDLDAMKKRGVSFEQFEPAAAAESPSVLFLAGITGFFSTAIFYKRGLRLGDRSAARALLGKAQDLPESSEETIRLFGRETAERVRNGLCFDRVIVENLPYEKLENAGEGFFFPPDPLLKAVAEAVAEAGPWNASMETVAKRSGLSKSGLYAHFKSKEDMLSRLFMSEFDRIAQCSSLRGKSGKSREERLYLTLISIADYLLHRQEIIIALDWVRIQQLELDLSVPPSLYDFFAGLKVEGSFTGLEENVSQWILLMLVSVLKHYCAIDTGAVTEKSDCPQSGHRQELAARNRLTDCRILRRLFRFICLGLSGFGAGS